MVDIRFPRNLKMKRQLLFPLTYQENSVHMHCHIMSRISQDYLTSQAMLLSTYLCAISQNKEFEGVKMFV
jgi:hypothetical protein